MTLSFIPLGLLSFLRLLTTTVVAGPMSSPMSWSPDGDWLSYTVVTDADREPLQPGWIFLTSTPGSSSTGPPAPTPPAEASVAPIYRIWATRRDHRSSALIEESHFPLTAPAWSPRGKSVAFGRFVPQSIEPAQIIQRGRYEVVIQDGLDRKQVVRSIADFELDPQTRASLPNLACSWSPDGLYLAIPRPGDQPTVEIVRTDNKKLVLVIDHACWPAWAPDGSKCAFVRHENDSNRLDYVERRGQAFDDPRPVAMLGPIPTAPYWNNDSRSIFAVVEKTPSRAHDLEIVRFVLEPSESIRVLNLAPEPMRRGAKIRGVVIDFDRDLERCFFAVDLEGRDSDVVWCLPRDRGTIQKRIPSVDGTQRVTGVSISPDGQLVAMRFGSERGLTPPVIYDTETEQTTLLVADEEARRAWLAELAGSARHLLLASLPPAMVDGQVAERPTVLPLPDELLPLHETAVVRLNRLARFGSTLCSSPADRAELIQRQVPRSFEPEARLFFDYLRGDFPAAAVDLDHLEPLLTSPRERLAILSLRAQLFWARGERSQARAVIDYLISCGDPNRRLVEETPFGLVFSPAPCPQQAWAQYLSIIAAKKPEPPKPVSDSELPGDVFDPRLQLPNAAPAPPIFDRPGDPIPFAPAREFP
jgi:Tol biopolymer transport system component